MKINTVLEFLLRAFLLQVYMFAIFRIERLNWTDKHEYFTRYFKCYVHSVIHSFINPLDQNTLI
jgi:hypothetical protein